MSTYRAVKHVNDWGVDKWSLQGLALADGMRVDALWPDGHVEQVTLREIQSTVTVSDHGNSYQTTTRRYVVDRVVGGVDVTVPAESLKYAPATIGGAA